MAGKLGKEISSSEGQRRSSDDQARAMQATREQHASEVAEDYVEAIGDLITHKGEARVVDLAGRLGVSHATVIQTVRRLKEDGLVTSEPYKPVFLTQKGEKLAAEVRHRHEITIAFLIKLGVSPEVAEMDAEGMEHHVSEETLEAFRRFLSQ